MNINSRGFMATGAVLAAVWVGLSAWSNHGPMALQAPPAWHSALSLHIVHALALLVLGLYMAWRPSIWAVAAGMGLLLGLILFCLTLEIKTLTGASFSTPWVPWGGSSLILGWLCWAVACVRPATPMKPF